MTKITVNISLETLSKLTGISYKALYGRYQKGYSDDSIITAPTKGSALKGRIRLSKDLIKLSKQTGISYNTLWWRYKQSKNMEELTKTPKEVGYNLKPSHRHKPVVMYNKYDNVIREYNSMTECAKDLHICLATIRKILNGESTRRKIMLKTI